MAFKSSDSMMLMKRAENKSPATWEDAIQMLRDDFEKRTDQIRQQFDKTVGKANQKVDRWNWTVSVLGQDAMDMVRKDLERRTEQFRIQLDKSIENGKKMIKDHPVLALGVLAAEAVVLEFLADLVPRRD